jgi:hypothetical protein
LIRIETIPAEDGFTTGYSVDDGNRLTMMHARTAKYLLSLATLSPRIRIEMVVTGRGGGLPEGQQEQVRISLMDEDSESCLAAIRIPPELGWGTEAFHEKIAERVRDLMWEEAHTMAGVAHTDDDFCIPLCLSIILNYYNLVEEYWGKYAHMNLAISLRRPHNPFGRDAYRFRTLSQIATFDNLVEEREIFGEGELISQPCYPDLDTLIKEHAETVAWPESYKPFLPAEVSGNET